MNQQRSPSIQVKLWTIWQQFKLLSPAFKPHFLQDIAWTLLSRIPWLGPDIALRFKTRHWASVHGRQGADHGHKHLEIKYPPTPLKQTNSQICSAKNWKEQGSSSEGMCWAQKFGIGQSRIRQFKILPNTSVSLPINIGEEQRKKQRKKPQTCFPFSYRPAPSYRLSSVKTLTKQLIAVKQKKEKCKTKQQLSSIRNISQ